MNKRSLSLLTHNPFVTKNFDKSCIKLTQNMTNRMHKDDARNPKALTSYAMIATSSQ